MERWIVLQLLSTSFCSRLGCVRQSLDLVLVVRLSRTCPPFSSNNSGANHMCLAGSTGRMLRLHPPILHPSLPLPSKSTSTPHALTFAFYPTPSAPLLLLPRGRFPPSPSRPHLYSTWQPEQPRRGMLGKRLI